MTAEQIQKLRALFFTELIPIEIRHKNVIKSSIKYCVILQPDGSLVTADWLNDYPEIKKEIEAQYDATLKQVQNV